MTLPKQLLLMGRLYVCLLFCCLAQASWAIHFFEGTYQQALRQSETEHKRILLYFTAKWCGPCRYMERNVFNSDSIRTVTDEHYIALKIDHDAWATKPLLDKYQIVGVPTFVVINAQEVIERQIGVLMRTAQFFAFLDQHWEPSLKVETLTQMSRDRYEQRKYERAHWRTELGVQAGANAMSVAHYATGLRVGYEVGLFVAFTKQRLSIRPGLSVGAKGGRGFSDQPIRLRYVEMPVQFSYLVRKTALFGLPGGFRANVSPYLAALTNGKNLPVKSVDYGTKIGLSAYVGDSSQLEAQIGYSMGLSNIARLNKETFYNRGVYATILFIL